MAAGAKVLRANFVECNTVTPTIAEGRERSGACSGLAELPEIQDFFGVWLPAMAVST
jgi:hypothetical protein